MTCARCGTANPDDARFCAMCGASLMRACDACGADLVRGAKFCVACGERAAAGAAEAGPSAAGPSAERRRVSVLFADLVGFTTLAEAMDPEDVRRVQSRYFEAARSVIRTYGGTIEKFIGDAVMAVFGAPTAHEDDAERAVRAGLALLYAVERLGSDASARGLRARAAVASGRTVVTVGAEGQGMVSGDLVNVAARLQARASPGGLLVDETTTRLAPDAAAFVAAGRLALKGRSARVAAYRAEPRATEPIGRRAGAHGGAFVGRHRELRELQDQLHAVIRDRRCRLVSVTGVAGIGKSRLVFELGQWVDGLEEAVAWHDGRAPSYGEGIAFAAVGEMVRRRIRVPQGAPPEIARRQLQASLPEFVTDEAERQWMEPRIATLLGEEVGPYDRDELFAAWRRFFERVSDRTPVVAVFEDLQWADPVLVDFVEHLASWARDHPILVVAVARPEFLHERPAWSSGAAHASAIHLERLPDEAIRVLLSQRAPNLGAALVERVLEQAGGIPLYAVEVARILASRDTDGDHHDGPDHPPQPAASDDASLVPETLHGVIAARIDALPPGERRLLRAAAVLGHRFRPDALAAVTGEGEAALRRRLDVLLRHELLTVDEELVSPGRGEVAFVQDLVRDVAAATVSRAERRGLHLAAARYLESLGDDVAEALAAHLVEAHGLTTDERERLRLARRAVAALRTAARRSMTLHVPARALRHLERGLALVGETDARAQLLVELADAARGAGQLDVAERHLRELVRIHSSRRERAQAAHARARLASVLLSAQRNATAIGELESAMRSLRTWARSASGVEIAAQLARARLLVGEDVEAVAWADRALDATRRLDLPGLELELLVTRGTALLGMGQAAAGIAALEEAVGRAQATGALHTELRARNNLAWWLLHDDPRAALRTARDGLELATTMGLGEAAIPLADIACTAAVEAGDWDWALEVVAQLEERGVDATYRIVLVATAAVIRALRGDSEPLAALDSLRPFPADADSQVLAAVQHAEAVAALLAGQLDDAQRLSEGAAAGYVGNEPAYQRAVAARAALWSGDAAYGERWLEQLDARPSSARGRRATAETVEAGVAALRGSSDAEERYRVAAGRWAELDVPLQRALAILDRHVLLGGGENELRPLLDRLGAAGLRRVAERVTGSAAARRPGRSRPPRAGTALRSDADRRSRPASDHRPPPG